MATTPDDTSEAFLREVDENLRRDQAQAMAKRFGPMIIGAILLFLAAIGGWMYWQDHQAKAAAVDSETLSSAMNDIAARKSAAAAPKLAQLTHSSSSGIAIEAKLTQAAEAIDANQRPAAIAIYRDIAADGSAAQRVAAPSIPVFAHQPDAKVPERRLCHLLGVMATEALSLDGIR